MSISSLPMDASATEKEDPFDDVEFSALKKQKKLQTNKSKESEVLVGKLQREGSFVKSFKSQSALLPSDPVRHQVQRVAEQSEGVIAQRHSEAEYRNSAFLGKTRGSSKSMSFRRSRAVKSSAHKSGRFSKLVSGQTASNRNDEMRLQILEQRVVNNTKNRKPIEDTTLMESGEVIEKFVYQLRVPAHGEKLEQRWHDYACIITKGETFNQPSSKPCQDCIGVASWKNFECIVVSDGHGKTGEEVAWQVSNWLPGRMLKSIITHSKANPDLNEAELFQQSTEIDVITDIFHECDSTVIWSKHLLNFRWVKIIGGEFEGLMAQICATNVDANDPLEIGLEGDEEEIPVCVFRNGQREFNTKRSSFGLFGSRWQPPNRQMELPIEQQLIPRKYLLCERDFYGGGTCLLFVRNTATNQFRYATAGDSRVLYIPPVKAQIPKNEDTAIKVRGKEYKPSTSMFSCFGGGRVLDPVPAYLSVEHNIHDEREYQRLQNEHPGCFIVGDGITSEAMEGYFYSNALFPYTGGLTPTRGFGDRLYYGSGYTCTPEVSKVLEMVEGSIIIGGSDGVFDDAVWGTNMEGLVYEVKRLSEEGFTAQEINEHIRDETAKRCHDWNLFRVDDISLFCMSDSKATRS